MRKALYILGYLTDADLLWMAQIGRRRILREREIIIREGVPIDALYLVLEGMLVVSVGDARSVADLGAGEVVGEIAFVEASPPSATVTAVRDAVVLEVPRSALESRLREDPGFASRFYRALAVFLAARLRSTTRRLGYGNEGDLAREAMLEDELDDALLARISDAGERFNRLVAAVSPRRG